MIKIKLNNKEIRKKLIDINKKLTDLADEIGVTYQTLNKILKSDDISSTQIGTIFMLSSSLGYGSVYDILEITYDEKEPNSQSHEAMGNQDSKIVLNDLINNDVISKWRQNP